MSLYKFHAFNDNTISALEVYSAWFAKPASFNDPFEGVYKEVTTPKKDEYINELLDSLFEQEPDIREIFTDPDPERKALAMEALTKMSRNIIRTQQASFHDSGICCFIKDGMVTPYEEPIMWGHYGNGLKGYVLRFDVVSTEMFESKDIGSIAVAYQNEPPVIDSIELLGTFMRKNNGQNGIIGPEIIKMITTKHMSWAYENEIRFISFGSGNKLFKYKEGAIKSIIIGSKMPEWQKRTIKAIANKHQITDLKEAFSRDDSYKVELRELSI